MVCRQWERISKGAGLRLRRLLAKAPALSWTQICGREEKVGTGAAAERCSHSAVYHPGLRSVFIFGGCTNAYTTFNDLWRLHCGERRWERVIPSGSFPSPKACASLSLYKDKLILFGGWSKSSPNPIHQTSIFFNELHIFDPLTHAWRSVECGAPHLAGHSASVLGDRLVVFGGSAGSESSNNVWVLNLIAEEWHQPVVEGPRPMPRYGQSQVLLSEDALLVVGGCGGPNLIFNDAWLLNMPADKAWTWEELRVTNPGYAAPQLWSHPSCRVGNRLITLSKSCKRRLEIAAARPRAVRRSSAADPQGSESGLLPPRRKLLTSRSLDEKEDRQTPAAAASVAGASVPTVQRAQSIPTIIVGEIPKLTVSVVGDNEAPPASLAVAASSLLPNQAAPASEPEQAGPSHQPSLPPSLPKLPETPGTKQQRNRAKQLAILQRMENLMQAQRAAATAHPSGNQPNFRPDSPPPPAKCERSESPSPTSRMEIYALDLSKALTEKTLTWSFVDSLGQGPEDRILYSLVEARGELVVFGGMRNGASASLGVESPFSHPITNHTFLLRPPIPF